MINKFIKFLEENNALEEFYKNTSVGCQHDFNDKIKPDDWIMSAFTWIDFGEEIEWVDLHHKWSTACASTSQLFNHCLTYTQILKFIESYTNSCVKEISIW